MSLRLVFTLLCLVFSTIFLAFLGQFCIIFSYPLSHDYISSPHPKSPHSPPKTKELEPKQITEFEEDGAVIIRKVLPDDIIEKLRRAAEDLKVNQTLHCSMAYFNGPPILHKYSYLCQWPEKAHDYFRDALYHGPLAHLASQLLGSQPVRVLNTIIMGSTLDKTIPRRWHSDYGTFTGDGECDNGLIMWMPLEETSHTRANGMLVSKGSNKPHKEIIQNGSWDASSGRLSGHVELMKFWKRVGESLPRVEPVLDVGDVLVMSKCTIHSASGVNTMRRSRIAWQIRFVSDPQTLQRGISRPYPGMGGINQSSDGLVGGSKFPLLWPHTLPEEDADRAAGHLILDRAEWAKLMISNMDHFVMTSFVRTAEKLGLFVPHHPVYAFIVSMGETLNIL